MSRSSDLMVLGLQEIGPHYADTLEEWRARFLAQLPEVARLDSTSGSSGRGTSTSRRAEALFRTRAIRDMQLVLGRLFEAAA